MLAVTSLPTAFAYVESDIPSGLTVADWHHERARDRRRTARPSWRRFIHVLPRPA